MTRLVVVGGGIAGLATAVRARDRAREAGADVDVTVLEAADRPGGNIRTERVDGFTVENGPNGFLDNAPETLDLVRRVGLEGRLERADDAAAKRYVYRSGRLHVVPTGPAAFLRSPLLGLPGRLRVFAEPLVPPRRSGGDESVFDFASRRIGSEAASVLVDAMVSGVFAGDVRRLSLPSAFPKMARMEAEHGGLVKAMLARMRARRAARKAGTPDEATRPGGPAGPAGTLTSFTGGLDELPRALAAELGRDLETGRRVTAVRRSADGDDGADGRGGHAPPAWTVELEGGDALPADAVVVALPAPKAAPLLGEVDPSLADEVAGIEGAGLAVVALGYREADVGSPDGFGFLVPRGEGPRILGCLWDSSIFPGRAPEGRVLVRAMIGGAHDPGAVGEDPDRLVEIVRADLATTMGLTAEPVLSRVYGWPLGIGQYVVGHGARLERIGQRLGALPGLWLAGSSYHGVSMNACIEKAGEQAAEVVGYLTRSRGSGPAPRRRAAAAAGPPPRPRG